MRVWMWDGDVGSRCGMQIRMLMGSKGAGTHPAHVVPHLKASLSWH